MTAGASPMEILVVGLSHRTAPIDLRERLNVPEQDLPKPLELMGNSSELVERMLVATCNRVEVYAVTEGEVEMAPVKERCNRLSEHSGSGVE